MARVGLTDERLIRMRADAAQLLPGTCVIQAATLTPDGEGGNAETWAAVTGGTVNCRFDAIAARSRTEVEAAAEAIRTYYVVTVPYDAPVAAARRVLFDSANYEIREVHTDDAWPVVRRLRVAMVE